MLLSVNTFRVLIEKIMSGLVDNETKCFLIRAQCGIISSFCAELISSNNFK